MIYDPLGCVGNRQCLRIRLAFTILVYVIRLRPRCLKGLIALCRLVGKGFSMKNSPAVVVGTFKSSDSEFWIRLEAFLSMRSRQTYETYHGIIREWCQFLGAEPGTDSGAHKLKSASDVHAMAYIKWLSGQPGEIPRLARMSRKSELQSRIEILPEVQTAERGPSKKMGLDNLQSNATIAKKIAALRRIYRMLIGSGLVAGINPFDADRVKSPPKEAGRKRPTEMLPFENVKSVIAAADDKTIKGLQDKAILACLFGGALRRSEIVNLRIDDVRRSQKGTLFLHLRSTKAGKDANQALPAWAAQIVQAHLKERKKLNAQPIDPLFCSFRGKAGLIPTQQGISSSGVYKLFKLYCKRADVGEFFTPHSARATSITKLLAEGIPHRQVQEFSRHSSVQMVEHYDKRRIGVDDSAAKDLDFD